jgi:eukaryotic-like serine/threonine-protein kinase
MAVGTGVLPERYTGAQPIGRGGMGEIFRATDTTLGRAVAVKVLDERYAQDTAVRERFTREALAVARLSGNANIVTIYDVGEHGDRPFIVMEYLAGGSLEQRLREGGPPPAAQSLDWLEQAANAIDAAHREGIVHRDLKPANLLLDRHGRIHVADFGIASAAGLGSLTQTGTILGTAAYFSPEQAKGERATPASDLYSLGVVAYELLTGRRPFSGETVAAEASAHITGEVPSVAPRLPEDLDPVFAKALAKDPAGRFGSAAEFVAALRAALAESAGPTSISAPPPPTVPLPPRPRTARRRPAWLLPLLGLLLAAGAGGGIAQALLSGGPDKETLTVTQPGTTVVTTVTPPPSTTTAAAPTTTTAPTTTAAAAASGDPHALNDQAWSLMKQGDYNGALPLLQQAVQQLGSNYDDIYTGYANYNLGITLMALGRCDEAMPYLETSWRVQPGRKEVRDAIKQARRCAGGGGD